MDSGSKLRISCVWWKREVIKLGLRLGKLGGELGLGDIIRSAVG